MCVAPGAVVRYLPAAARVLSVPVAVFHSLKVSLSPKVGERLPPLEQEPKGFRVGARAALGDL